MILIATNVLTFLHFRYKTDAANSKRIDKLLAMQDTTSQGNWKTKL